MLVKWLNREKPGGKAAYDAGLRQGDVIVGLEGKPIQYTESKFHTHLKLNYSIGDTLPLTILRDGRSMHIDVPLVE